MQRTKSVSQQSSGIGVRELLSLLPQDLLDRLCYELQVDKWVKKLPAEPLFKLVLFSLLNSERLSLRVMEENYSDPLFQALVPALAGDKVTWVGIRNRLIKLKSGYARGLYEHVYEQAKSLYGAKTLAGYQLKRYDSTLMVTFAHLLKGMKVGNSQNGKQQVKLTTELSDDFLIQMHFHQDQSHLSEETALKQAIEQAQHQDDEISVFDKGLKSRQTFQQLDEQGVLFVGRLQANARYELLHPHWQADYDHYSDNEDIELIQDSAVHLYGNGKQRIEHPFRMVQFRLKGHDNSLYFVTNIWDLPALVIAEVYRQRWDIEVLFRFMKQEMNLTHFVCNELNAIENMLYFTMMTTMLVLIYKQQNGMPSYKLAKIRLFKELLCLIVLDCLDHPDDLEWLKQRLLLFVQKKE